MTGVYIKEFVGMSLIVEEYIKRLYEIYEKGDIESESFNNALSIVNLIKKLHSENQLSDFDVVTLTGVAGGFSLSEIALMVDADRRKVSNSFKKSCTKLAYILGGRFTDSGFFDGRVTKDVEEYLKRKGIYE